MTVANTTLKKITVEVDERTLAAAQDGAGVAETVREALKLLAHKRASQRLLAAQGKLDLGLNLDELRKDKGEE